MYKYAETRHRSHQVHVDGGKAFKVENCNLDDAAYFSLLDERPPGKPHCKHCAIPGETPAEQAEREKREEQVPALGKNDLPRSLLVIPKRLLAILLIAIAALPFIAGAASGVVLSPDDERGGDTGGVATCDPGTLEGCGDLVLIIERLIDEQLLRHLTIDHVPEASPSRSPSSQPTTAIPSPSASPRPDPTSGPRTPPTTPSRPTRRPSPTATPTARPVSPSATPCFHPGQPRSGRDPCLWPPDDK